MDFLPFFFFLIAFIYSIAGFAGGSSYLMALTLAGVPHTESAPIALLCNVAVSSIGVWNFHRSGVLRWRWVLPFLVFSMPMAYLGARVTIARETFMLLLAFSLSVAALRIFFVRTTVETQSPSQKKLWMRTLPVGSSMGFFSGMIGIGGGIFLSPFLILSKWATVRQASAAASLFILANSLSGLAGKPQSLSAVHDALPFILMASLGGFFGSRLATGRLPQPVVQRVLAAVILFVSVNLALKAIG